MKKYFKYSALALSALLFATGCSTTDSTAPSLEGVALLDYDLIQVTNDMAGLPVIIKANDNEKLSKIEIAVTPDGGSTPVAMQELKNIAAGSLNRASLNIPFPLPEKAPSGVYSINYTITDAAGNKSTKSYKVNVANYQTARVDKCAFPTVGLTGDKTVTLFVTAPANTEGDLYVSGNFEKAAGGTGDWTGGGTAALKFTKVSNTCYYISLKLDGSSEFKITRGNWDKRMQDAEGKDPDNLKWNNQKEMTYTIGNWADRVVLAPASIPTSAIASNKLTVLTDVKSTDAAKYFMVRKGATSLTDAIPMTRLNATSTKLAAAVPREGEYVLVKDNVTSIGVNAYGYEQTASWDGKTNPVNLIVDGYKGSTPLLTNNQKLFIVGDATAGGWNNPVPANQEFKRVAEGKFELTLPLDQKEYLLLPVNGDWSFKWGMAGTNPLGGNLNWQGANFKAPVAGTYKIEVDFFKGTYKLTKQ